MLGNSLVRIDMSLIVYKWSMMLYTLLKPACLRNCAMSSLLYSMSAMILVNIL